MKEKLRQLWAAGSPRERRLVGGGLAVLLVVVLFMEVWQPLDLARKKTRASLPQLKADLEVMRSNAAEVARLKKMSLAKSPPGGGIREAVEQSAAVFKLRSSISRLDAGNAGRITLVLPTVAFDDWLRWVGHLHERQHIRVESCRVEALPQPGLVAISAVLTGS